MWPPCWCRWLICCSTSSFSWGCGGGTDIAATVTPRVAAFDILQRIDRAGSFSGLTLNSTLGRLSLSAPDAALATALVYGVTERRVTLDYFIARFSGRPVEKIHPDLLNILRLGACQILFMDRIPQSAAVNESVNLVGRTGKSYAKGFVNRVLRELCRSLERLPYPDKQQDFLLWLSVRYSCPRALIESFQSDYGLDAAEGILTSLEEKKNHAVKVNTLLITPDALAETLAEEGVKARRSALFDDMLELPSLPELGKSPAFRNGLFHVQGYGSRLCCAALGAGPGERVLDLCAAPGGKSFTLAQMMQDQGEVLACDLHENRLRLIREGASRLKLNCIRVLRNDAAKPCEALGKARRVLCDVPCSGYGVMAAKPEIRYKDPAGFSGLPETQYRILCEGARHLEPGGTLVYSTCTLRRAENDEVAQRFLAEHAGFEPQPLPAGFGASGAPFLTLMPQLHHTEGFFIACFRKNPDSY